METTMTIPKEKVLANSQKYFETGAKYNFMPDDLVNFLGTDIITAPASTQTDLNNCFEGGLIAHLLLVTKYAINLNNILPENQRVALESIIKVSCLHQIGKAKLYVQSSDDWRIKKGWLYDFNDTLTSMKIGERSAYYAMSNGVELSEEEFQAIVNYCKDDNDKQAKHHSSTLAVILKQANALAILEEKNNG